MGENEVTVTSELHAQQKEQRALESPTEGSRRQCTARRVSGVKEEGERHAQCKMGSRIFTGGEGKGRDFGVNRNLYFSTAYYRILDMLPAPRWSTRPQKKPWKTPASRCSKGPWQGPLLQGHHGCDGDAERSGFP